MRRGKITIFISTVPKAFGIEAADTGKGRVWADPEKASFAESRSFVILLGPVGKGDRQDWEREERARRAPRPRKKNNVLVENRVVTVLVGGFGGEKKGAECNACWASARKKTIG